MKLYLKGLIDKEPPEDISKFLDDFLMKDNIITKDITSKMHYPKATYFDPKCEKIHCYAAKMRSFDDICDLVNTYYKSIKPVDIFHLLLTKVYTGKVQKYNTEGSVIYSDSRMYVQFSNCGTMQKIRVWYGTVGNMMNTFQYSNSIQCNKYQSKFNWKELFDMLNIKSNEQAIDYIIKNQVIV